MPLKDIIANLADDQEIQIGENKVKVADVKGELAAFEKMVPREDYDKIKTEHDTMANSVVDFLNKAASTTLETPQQPQQTPIDPRTAIREGLKDILFKEQGYDYSKDQYVGPAMQKTRDEAYQAAVRDVTARYDPIIDSLNKNQSMLYNAAVLAEENSWYRMNRKELPKRPDGKDYSLADLRQLGQANNIIDPVRKIVDLDEVLNRLTYPQRAEAERKQLQEEAYKKGINDARSAAAGSIVDFPYRQGVRVGEQKTQNTEGKSARQIVDEALSNALNDPDLLNLQSA